MNLTDKLKLFFFGKPIKVDYQFEMTEKEFRDKAYSHLLDIKKPKSFYSLKERIIYESLTASNNEIFIKPDRSRWRKRTGDSILIKGTITPTGNEILIFKTTIHKTKFLKLSQVLLSILFLFGLITLFIPFTKFDDLIEPILSFFIIFSFYLILGLIEFYTMQRQIDNFKDHFIDVIKK